MHHRYLLHIFVDGSIKDCKTDNVRLHVESSIIDHFKACFGDMPYKRLKLLIK